MALHAELHRHLGGAVVPRVFWRFLVRNGHPLSEQYPDYESFEEFFTRPRASLSEYLELHSLVESVQTMQTIPYFVSKLVRGAYIFEGICYLELRYTPYYRTDSTKSEEWRIGQMRDVVRLVAESASDSRYPLLMRQIRVRHRLQLNIMQFLEYLLDLGLLFDGEIELGGQDFHLVVHVGHVLRGGPALVSSVRRSSRLLCVQSQCNA